MVSNSDDETNSSHKIFLNNRQVASLRKVFTSNSSADIKL